MDITRAERIVKEMAKQRCKTVDAVLAEFNKYQKNGKCNHFWPDENAACARLIEQQTERV